ncbi:hypothetical protein SAMN02745216_02619 [Desulfatibacillum alkenivorans DSM 16219]|jgi:hypothetical protein|uniref:Uncharacterized protein n=1 Tax=Desulfatibacillum alkenivorans DSM 16219 TaxID=1121393 RepID=A0A1M6NL30_9BACT|nr:hypothetical protein [Desulfatibacillum alkenivorans]SHJ96413.1 hypothetical protein SAMN02745216_02619 [Desulfatibacillum alkenivorans DSM 16219]
MQKIVIVSSQPDKDNPLLVAMLNVLFPECEIQVTNGAAESDFDGIASEPIEFDLRAGRDETSNFEC